MYMYIYIYIYVYIYVYINTRIHTSKIKSLLVFKSKRVIEFSMVNVFHRPKDSFGCLVFKNVKFI